MHFREQKVDILVAKPAFIIDLIIPNSLQSRHNGHDNVSNHQPHHFYSTVHSGADQRKHQSSASLAFMQGIHRGPMNPPHKWLVTRKMFPFDDVIMYERLVNFAIKYNRSFLLVLQKVNVIETYYHAIYELSLLLPFIIHYHWVTMQCLLA